MKNSIYKFFGTIGIVTAVCSSALANQTVDSVTGPKQPVYGEKNAAGYTPILFPTCGMLVGLDEEDSSYVLENDIICTTNDLRSRDTNAAVILAGKNVHLNLNGHTIKFIGREVANTSYLPTQSISSIGVHMVGAGGKLTGTFSDEGYGTIWGFGVGVEIGDIPGSPTNSKATTSFPSDAGRNHVSKVQSVRCNSGFRMLNNGNVISESKANCGKLEQFDKLDHTSISRDGFVIGIKSIENESSCENGHERYESIYGNRVHNSIAIGNENGFIGGNDLTLFSSTPPRFPVITNTIVNNQVSQNNNNGIYIPGTGFLVKGNEMERNGAGIDVSRANPACGPQGAVNLIKENTVSRSQGRGISATAFGDDLVTTGALFIDNYSIDNNGLDFYDENDECASGDTELDEYNIWNGNLPHTASNNKPCVLD